MPHPILERFASLRRRLRIAGIVRGFALTVAGGLALTALAAGLDWWVRPEAVALRLLLTATIVLPTLWLLAREVWPPLWSEPDNLELARRIEFRDQTWAGHPGCQCGVPAGTGKWLAGAARPRH